MSRVGTYPSHKTKHQDGGADEVSVAALSGELADRQLSKAGNATLGWTSLKLLKGAGAGSAPTEIDVPSPGATITSGTYTGNNTENRAIPHGLGVTPKVVFITVAAETGVFFFHLHIAIAIIMCMSSSVSMGYPITAPNTTNFYVGNALAYERTANAAANPYVWVALV